MDLSADQHAALRRVELRRLEELFSRLVAEGDEVTALGVWEALQAARDS